MLRTCFCLKVATFELQLEKCTSRAAFLLTSDDLEASYYFPADKFSLSSHSCKTVLRILLSYLELRFSAEKIKVRTAHRESASTRDRLHRGQGIRSSHVRRVVRCQEASATALGRRHKASDSCRADSFISLRFLSTSNMAARKERQETTSDKQRGV